MRPDLMRPDLMRSVSLRAVSLRAVSWRAVLFPAVLFPALAMRRGVSRAGLAIGCVTLAGGALASGLWVGTASAATGGRTAPKVRQGAEFVQFDPVRTDGACAPLAVISRGLGSGVNPMRGLATSLAQNGWRVVVMRHPEAPRSMFAGRLVRSGRLQPKTGEEQDPASLRRRASEIGEAVALGSKTCAPPFKALIGHAVGSTTTLIEAGAKPRFSVSAKDRFDAYVALSPAGPGGAFQAGAWKNVAKPTLVVTGSRDRIGRNGWRPRTAAYDDMPPGGKRLAIVQGATHLAIGGVGSTVVRQKVARIVNEFLDQLRAGGLKTPTPIAGVEYRGK